MLYPIKRFFRKIKRVIDFLPMIWKGYDFDSGYATELFAYQLERIADFLESNRAMAMDAKMRASKIRTALRLMKKVEDEDYAMEYQDRIQEKYGNDAYKFEFKDIGNDLFELRWSYQDYPNADEIEKFVEIEFKKSQQKQARAKRILWAYIEHNIDSWWD